MQLKYGFTLVELLVTLAIVAILVNVAAPSFTAFQRNAELSAVANTLLSSLNAARGEAMKRNRSAMVAPLDPKDWGNGWVVFVDVDDSKTFTLASGDIMLFEQKALPSYFHVNANGSADTATKPNPYILYDSSGFPEVPGQNLTFTIQRNDIVDPASKGEVRRLKIAVTGRTKVCKPTSDTDPNCP